MAKKLLSVLLVLCMILSYAPMATYAAMPTDRDMETELVVNSTSSSNPTNLSKGETTIEFGKARQYFKFTATTAGEYTITFTPADASQTVYHNIGGSKYGSTSATVELEAGASVSFQTYLYNIDGSKYSAMAGTMVITITGGSEAPEVPEHTCTGGEATCKALAVCEICYQPYGEYAPCNSLGVVEPVGATCTEPGVVGGTYCTVCLTGKTAAEAATEALGHDFSETTGECSRCDAVDPTFCAHEHTEFRDGKEMYCHPTYGYEGYEGDIYCTDCDTKIGEGATIPMEHTIVTVEEKPATCFQDGNTEYTRCTVCREKWDYELIEARDYHVNGELVIENEDEDSYDEVYYCVDCGLESYRETIMKVCEHTGGTATCTEQAVCTICGEFYGELAGHSFADGSCTDCGTEDPDYVPTCVKVATLNELLAALADDSNNLPIVITETIVIEAGKTVTIDLNGKTVTVPEADKNHIYAIDNQGNLTLKDSVGGGSITSRGIYNGYNANSENATLTVESGKYVGMDTNGGAAIFNGAELIINGGEFYGGSCALNNSLDTANAIINGGTFGGAYDGGKSTNYVIQSNKGTLTIHDANVVSGWGAVGCYGGTTVINGGSFLPTGWATKTCHVVYVAAAGNVTINGGTFKLNYAEGQEPDSGSAVVSYYKGTLSITGGTFYSHFDNVSPVELSAGSVITGGTFLNHSGNPIQHSYVTNFIAEGYELGEDGKVVKQANYVAEINGKGYETLEEALADLVDGNTLTLLADIELSSTLVIKKAITLDGNGYTLTYTGSGSSARAINVREANGVTIKNLTIDAAKAERAINIIQGATNVTIHNVTATAANYTVNVAASAPNAVVIITESTLNGLCTVNVTAAGANITVTDTVINCNDNNTTAGESYAALSLGYEAAGGKIIANGCTINVAEGSDSLVAKLVAPEGQILIDGSAENVAVMVAIITYPGPYYHSFATLESAIEFAKVGDTITMIRDASVDSDVVLKAGVTYLIGEGMTLTVNANVVAEAGATLNCYGTIVVNGTADISALVYGTTFGACGGKLTVTATGKVFMLNTWEGVWTPINDSQLGAMLKNCEVGAKINVGSQEWSLTESGWAHMNHVGGTATCTKQAECTVCGASYGELANHTEQVIPGKQPTCTETGLTAGLKCSVCGETLVEQEEIPALGHEDENGDNICDNGEHVMTGLIGDYYYVDGEIMAGAGLVKVGDFYYFVNSRGMIIKNTTKWISGTNSFGFEAGNYEFDENGHMVLTTGLVGDYYYENGLPAAGKGLIKIGEDFYYVDQSGKILKDTTKWISGDNAYGLVAGNYQFDANGKMEMFTGVKGDYYYENGTIAKGVGLVKIGEDFYYVDKAGKVLKDTTKWISGENDYELAKGRYLFGADGKMIRGNGLVKIGEDYYYFKPTGDIYIGTKWISADNGYELTKGRYLFGDDGKMVRTAGLVKVGTDYYYLRADFTVFTGSKYISTNDLGLEKGRYTFGDDGKLIMP